jgi:tripeptide aminopeptidase
MRLSILLLAAAAPLAAQAAIHPRVQQALDRIKTDNAWTLEQQRTLCEIPAPPFKETARGLEIKRRFEALGYANARIDSIGNVIVEKRGAIAGPAVVIAGHLDTVFPEGTDVTVKTTGTRMAGPGIGDDCRGLAVLLAVARAFATSNIETNQTVYFVANVGEEGPGNLRGVRYLFDRELKGRIGSFISVDGAGEAGQITHRAVGSIRYTVTFRGPGGHSYGAFGRPNPIHALGRAIAEFGDITVPAIPKTTFNVGVITGGTSVNSIPFEGSAQIDMRSESEVELKKVDAKLMRILARARDAENARWKATDPNRRISFTIDTIGIRPANSAQTEKTPLVAAAVLAAKQLGVATTRLGASSTDANLPMSIGIPAITIDGGGRGGDAHALTEWYDDGPRGWLGAQWAALLVANLAGVRP